MAMFHLLKIRTSIDIFKNEKCKVTFGLEYSLKLTRFPTQRWYPRLTSRVTSFGTSSPQTDGFNEDM